MTPTPSPGSPAGDARQAKNSSQVVSVNISEPNPDSPSRFHLEVSECVETRTVTTTTRLTRKSPHVFDSNPTPLECLDTKEFPLAMKPTPPELLAFTYNIAAEGVGADTHMANPVGFPPASSPPDLLTQLPAVAPGQGIIFRRTHSHRQDRTFPRHTITEPCPATILAFPV